MRSKKIDLTKKAAILSIKPNYAEQILSGEKKVEFRRVWARIPVSSLLLYASSPIKKFVGVAYVDEVIEAEPSELWKYAEEYGGGVTKSQLDKYLDGKEKAFAIVIKSSLRSKFNKDPSDLYSKFRAPQSYSYLSDEEFNKAFVKLFSGV